MTVGSLTGALAFDPCGVDLSTHRLGLLAQAFRLLAEFSSLLFALALFLLEFLYLQFVLHRFFRR